MEEPADLDLQRLGDALEIGDGEFGKIALDLADIADRAVDALRQCRDRKPLGLAQVADLPADEDALGGFANPLLSGSGLRHARILPNRACTDARMLHPCE